MTTLRTLFAALLLVAPGAFAQDTPKIAFEKYKLGNGLEVVLVEDHRLPLVALDIWYHVGAVNEEPGRTGFAHLFEHMMFAATKHVPRGLADQLTEGAGATDSNGSTDFDRTNYYDTWPSNQLELGLWIHSDKMGYLLDVLDQTALMNQQDVVRNERRQRVENQPYGIVEEALFHSLFPKVHPYYASVIGSHADIQAATQGDIKKFFKLYYSPNNATLVLAGDIDKARAKALVEKYFGSFKRGPDVPAIKAETPPITGERRLEVRDSVELQRVYMGWLTPTAYKAGDAELDLTAQVLAGGKSSRLYKKLVYELQIAQDVDSNQQSLDLASVFGITVTARPGHAAKEIEAAIDAELDKFRREGPDAKELERAKNTIETGMIGSLEKVLRLAERMQRYNHYLHDPGFLAQDLERYRSATPESVRKVAEAQLAKDKRVVIYALPGKQDLGAEVPTPAAVKSAPGAGTESVNADEPWRKDPPGAGPAPKLALPVASSFRLSNGLTVIYQRVSQIPIVAARLVVKSGSGSNPIAKPGLASFTAEMLGEGTKTRSSVQLADDVAQLGAELDTGSSPESSHVALTVLRKNLPAALDIIADVTLHPAFAQEEIDRRKASRLASLVQVREDPNQLVGKVAASALFGDKHPLGYLEIGTDTSVKATTRGDLESFWKAHYVPANAALIVAGDIDADELKALAEKSLGAWKGGAAPKEAAAQPKTTAARLVIVDKPGAQQTATRVATIGPSRHTPDYPALSVMNAALGGLFSSRINNNLREEKGYTYGAASGFQYRRTTGTFAVRTSLRTDVTGPGISEIFKEIAGMRDKPVGGDELARARDSQVRSLPGRFETSANTVGAFDGLYNFDLGFDYFARLPAQLNAVTAQSMLDAARKYVVPEKLTVIVVGDRSKIEPGLAKLKLGKEEVRKGD